MLLLVTGELQAPPESLRDLAIRGEGSPGQNEVGVGGQEGPGPWDHRGLGTQVHSAPGAGE